MSTGCSSYTPVPNGTFVANAAVEQSTFRSEESLSSQNTPPKKIKKSKKEKKDEQPESSLLSNTSILTETLPPEEPPTNLSDATMAHILQHGLALEEAPTETRKSSRKSKKADQDNDSNGTHTPMIATSLPYRFDYYTGQFSKKMENGRDRIYTDPSDMIYDMESEGRRMFQCPMKGCAIGIMGDTKEDRTDIGASRNHLMSHLDEANRLFNPDGIDMDMKELRKSMKHLPLFPDYYNECFSTTPPNAPRQVVPEAFQQARKVKATPQVSSYGAPPTKPVPIPTVQQVASYGAPPPPRPTIPVPKAPIPTVAAPWVGHANKHSRIDLRNPPRDEYPLRQTQQRFVKKEPFVPPTPRVEGPTDVALFDMNLEIRCPYDGECRNQGKTEDMHLPPCGLCHSKKGVYLHVLAQGINYKVANLCPREQPHLFGKIGRESRCQNMSNCPFNHLQGRAKATAKAIERHSESADLSYTTKKRLGRVVDWYNDMIAKASAPVPASRQRAPRTSGSTEEDWRKYPHAPAKIREDIVYQPGYSTSEESSDDEL